MRTILALLFCLFGVAAHAEKYCHHPVVGLFGAEGDTKSLTWEMTVLSSRTEPGPENCSKEFIFLHGLDQPIQIMVKPRHFKASIENDNTVVVVPDRLKNDTMTIKILHKTRKGRVRTAYVNYFIRVKDRAL
jgi:hypothetical protein